MRTLWLAAALICVGLGPLGTVILTGLGYLDRSSGPFIMVPSLIIGSVLALHATSYEGKRRKQALSDAKEDPKEVLRRRVERVNEAVATAASEMQGLQRDLEAQQAAGAALLAQAEEQQRLLEINQDQAEKIRHILVSETKATIRAERRQQWMFFALGAAVSIPIGIVINLLVP